MKILACLESWKYVTGSLLNEKFSTENDKECWNKCNLDEECRFWDYQNGNCRLLLNEGDGPVAGYDGAMSGKKSCLRIKPGPNRMFFISFVRLELKCGYIFLNYKFQNDQVSYFMCQRLNVAT